MTTITPLPTPPSRSNPASFSDRTDAFLSALSTFVTETNIVAGEVNNDATTASTAASTATAASVSANEAADNAASTTNVTKWESGTTYAQGQVVWSPTDFQTYRRTVAGSGTTDPASDSTNWEPISAKRALIPLSSRDSNTQIVVGDRGSIIDCTGTWTQTFAPCSTLKSGWWCYIRNSGTGEITIDPDSSETIDGLTTFKMYPGEMRLVQCNGSVLTSIVINGFTTTFTATSTWIKPPGYSRFEGLLWGGGGAGGRSGNSTTTGGGGGGACVPFQFLASSLGSTETVTIAATTTGPSTASAGGTGGNSTFSTVTAYGGGGGGSGNCGGSGGGAQSAGLQATVSDNLQGGQPTLDITVTSLWANPGFGGGNGSKTAGRGDATYGGAGGGDATNTGGKSLYGGGGGGGGGSSDSTGGSSVFGGSGGAGKNTASGVNGTAPGGGGGGTRTGTKAGDGARGECRVWGVS